MNIRQKNPDIALPDTVIKKEHFLDNVFGPANYSPDVAAGSATQWVSGLGKKFIDGRNEMGIAGMFETGMGISGNDVTFFASIIDEYRPGITLGRSQVKESKPETGGKSQNPSLMAELKRTWYEDRNFALQKQELSGSTFYIMDQKTLAPPTNISGQISLVISKSEYDSIAIPSNMDTMVHTPLLSFGSFSLETDTDGVPYRKAALKVNGMTSGGTVATATLGPQMLTFNYSMLNTEAAGNLVELEAAENGILTVDEFMDALKVVENKYREYDGLIETCTRLRVHYYGGARDLPTDWDYPNDAVKGRIFDNTLPLSNYFYSTYPPSGIEGSYRKLYGSMLPRQIYNQLTSHADENGPKGNPSPYLIKDTYFIDLGQVLYGFESIFYQHHVPPSTLFPPDEDTYSPSYENFPVKIVNDLAGWLANIATPATEYFIHVRDGVSPYEGKVENPPSTLQEYFDFSAPEADLFGNADGIGIWQAYNALKDANPLVELKLSDVFTLYYKGNSELREELNPANTASPPYCTSDERWKILALFFNFMSPNGNGFDWHPDNSTLWENIMQDYNSNNNPEGRDYNTRLMGFAEFWYNALFPIHGKWMGFYYLLFNREVPESFIIRFSQNEFQNTGQSEIEFVKSQIHKCFHDKFLLTINNVLFL